MTYQIEYQNPTTNESCWYGHEGRYPSHDEAQRAAHDLIALGGPWGYRAYRVRLVERTALTHAGLVSLGERLENRGAVVTFWFGDDGAEANHAISALRDRIDTDQLADLVREVLRVLVQRPVAGSEPKRR
jgi:hypothetical protein